MAIGVFVGFTPPLGLQMITAAVLATLTHSNRAAAVAAVWITNPFTALPIYVLTYRVGRYLIGDGEAIDIRQRLRAVVVDEHGEWLHLSEQFRELLSLGWGVLGPMTLGGVMLGLPAAAAGYLLTRWLIAAAHRVFHFHSRSNG